MRLVGMLMVYNEVEKGNLYRCLRSLQEYCDDAVVYDDASTDSSVELCKQLGCYIIEGKRNDFKNELEHKQMQLEKCKEIGADWILRIDADEVMDYRGVKGIRSLLEQTDKPSFAFHTINFWRSPNFYRLDSGYNDVVFNRLWRCRPDLRFDVKPGLHLTNYPIGATDNEGFAPFEILHYGFGSNEAILDKYHMYRELGQSGWALNRLIDETTLKVARSKPEWFDEQPPADKFEDVFQFAIAECV